MKAVFLGSLFLFIAACSDDKGKLVCKVVNEELYDAEVKVQMDALGLDYTSDKQKLTFITTWAQSVQYKLALQDLNFNQYNKAQSQITQYEKDIFEFYVQNEKINEVTDTLVTEQEIKDYYDSHKKEFTLEDFIVKAMYIKVPENSEAIAELEKVYLLKNNKDIDLVKNYANLYASNFYYEPEKWIFFDDLIRDLPLDEINKERFVKNKSKVWFTKEGSAYFLNLLDYKLKDATSPYEFERGKIKERILLQRIKQQRITLKTQINKELNETYKVDFYLD